MESDIVVLTEKIFKMVSGRKNITPSDFYILICISAEIQKYSETLKRKLADVQQVKK